MTRTYFAYLNIIKIKISKTIFLLLNLLHNYIFGNMPDQWVTFGDQ